MSRIAKADVNSALQLAAQTILKAGGDDGRVSRAEMAKALKTMPKEQRPLADIFFRFIDARDFKKGAQVTKSDVNRAVAYAKTHMVAKYDLNNNGLSKDEVSKMSLTGKRAVDLARALKGAATVPSGGDTGRKLDSAALGVEINKFAPKTDYMSESDYAAQYFSAAAPAGDITGQGTMKALQPELEKLFETPAGKLFDGATAEVWSVKETKDWMKGLSDTQADDEPAQLESAKAFAEVTKLINANLTDVRVVRVGPKEDGSDKLATDHGLYADMIVGRAADGKLAGVIIGSVET